ncbi:Nuclear transport factor 2 [Cynara cardunculus var. scolymus]|uniref:Nuclear transport factor 2 n=1 Tax=Cynara cardunculus var. scolymus TaxID=59895 RepID=A0A124SD91_CYNCS|nr:Nuclear transport factor 2 [Cynara cardunculus var. scolymus]
MVRKSRFSKVPSLPSIPKTNTHPYGHRLSAQAVAQAFVERYYQVLHAHPEDAHKFYKDQSILSRPNADGSMRTITTAKGIKDEIMASDIKDWTTKVLSMHAQDSLEDSVFIGVAGALHNKDNATRYFSQNFFLAPQTKGFYVHNDFFQFIDEGIRPKITEDCVQIIMKDKCTSTEDDIDNRNQISADSSDTKNSVLPDDQKISASPIAQSVSCTDQEVVKKVSYASIVAKASSLPSSNAAVKILQNKEKQSHDPPSVVPVKPSSPPKNAEGTITEAAHKVLEKEQNHKTSSTEESSGAKNDDQLVEKNSPDSDGQESANKETYASIVAKPIPPQASRQVLADKPSSSTISTIPPKQGPAPSFVRTVLIKDIPPHLKLNVLTKALRSRFGSLNHKYIQIQEYEDGYRYAFVEFNQPKSARQAVQVGSIKFADWECQIEPKKSKQDSEARGVRGSCGTNRGGNCCSSI